MPTKKMTQEHKDALAKGRSQGRAVKEYLAILDTERKRGPKLTRERLEARIEETRQAIEAEADPSRKLELIQKRIDDEDRLAAMADEVDATAVEAAFVEIAAEYSDRKGITWTAWREFGVPAAVLKAASVPRTRRSS